MFSKRSNNNPQIFLGIFCTFRQYNVASRGVTKKMKAIDNDLVVVENRTVVTNATKRRAQQLRRKDEKYKLPVKYNFKPSDMRWVTYEPKGPMLVLDKIFPNGIVSPIIVDKNVVHLPSNTHSPIIIRNENAFGALLDKSRHYRYPQIHETLVDLLHPKIR